MTPRMAIGPLVPILGVVSMAIAGCSFLPLGSSSRAVAVGDTLLVANASTGEQCQLRKLRDLGTGLRIEDFEIACAGWSTPSGLVRRLELRPELDLEPLLVRPELALLDEATLRCSALERVSGAAGEVLVRQCTGADGLPLLISALRDTDEPRLTYVAYGLPQTATIVESLAGGELQGVLRGGARSPYLVLASQTAEHEGRPLTLTEIMNYRELVALGRAYNQAGDFASATQAYERAYGLLAELDGADSTAAIPLLSALGLNLANEGRASEAEGSFETARRIGEAKGFGATQAQYLTYRAAAARRAGDLERARELIGRAVRARSTVEAQSTTLANSLLVEAGILAELGRLNEARDSVERALAIAQNEADFVTQSYVQARRAAIARQSGDLRLARRSATIAERLTRELFGDGPNLAEVLIERGKIESAAGDRRAAIEAYARAIAIMAATPSTTRPLAASEVAPYLDLLLVTTEGPTNAVDFARAIEALQLVKAPVIDRAVLRMTARLATDDPEIRTLAHELDGARGRREQAQLAVGQFRLGDAAAAGRQADEEALAEELARSGAAVDRLERELQARFPRYGALVATTPVGFDELSASLASQEGVLRIAVAPEASYAFLMRGDGRAAAHRGPLGEGPLRTRVQALRSALTFASGSPPPFDLAAAHDLYRDLLGPLGTELAGLQHLVIVADGPLMSLPLGVLVREPARTGDYANASWLGRDLALSVMPSLRSFVRARASLTASAARRPFLGVGDPDFAGAGSSRAAVDAAMAACRERGVFDPTLLRGLPALPETRDELVRVADALGRTESEIVTGDAATVERVEQLALDDFRVISFATHGLLADDLACRNEPALALTPPTSASGGDGLLDSSDITRLELDADWVVLSACNTAGPSGRLGGEALSGLATAFSYAGARALLASHWDVASEATVELMVGTFETARSAPENGRAAALQAAQRRLLNQPALAHPAFWAPFVLIGDGGPQPRGRERAS